VRLSALITSPLALLSACGWLNCWNPMQRAFEESFVVRNHSRDTLRVTPIGHFDDSARRRVLPQHSPTDPTFPALADSRRIQPGEEARITYDADDITLSELVVESDVLAVPAVVSARVSTPKAVYIIRDIGSLPPATGEHLDGLRRGASLHQWSIMFAFVIPLGLLGISAIRFAKREAA